MAVRLIQLETDNKRQVAVVADDGSAKLLKGYSTTYELCLAAFRAGVPSSEFIPPLVTDVAVDYKGALAAGHVLPPLDHPDPAHCYVTGTGLTHLGSAAGRDKMHAKVAGQENLTDSMKMFNMGLEGGKNDTGTGVQPEWFYKGDGSVIVKPGGNFLSPQFALDGSEEPEMVGLYLVSDEGVPFRCGFCLGNEFSDHVTERQNYLYLAHSKLRNCSFGPELLVGELPSDIQGMSRIYRGDKVLWEKPFVSGEENMSHYIANLEHHHFKYKQFCRPGDLHIHYFGTATLSFSDDVRTEVGDTFEIEAPPFVAPLRNSIAVDEYEAPQMANVWEAAKVPALAKL